MLHIRKMEEKLKLGFYLRQMQLLLLLCNIISSLIHFNTVHLKMKKEKAMLFRRKTN